MNELLTNILGIVVIVITLYVLIAVLILSITAVIKTERKQEEYIQTLNEHDKSIILTYKSLSKTFYLPKRKKKINE